MTYRLTPELPGNTYRIMDCASADSPRRKAGSQPKSNTFVASVGVIGGAVSQTMMPTGAEKTEHEHRSVFSSLHFEPVDKVEWRISFLEKLLEDITVQLIE